MTDTIRERFRVTESLLRRSLGDAYAADVARIPDDAVSTTDAIERAVALFTPEPCGNPLIRIGPPRDGGYLVPDELAGIDACFSPGTNNVKRFEDELAKRYRIRSFMCDRSSDVEALRTPLIPGFQTFEKKWLDVEPGEDDLDINDWVRDNARPDHDLLLQMDIEGAEYRNLLHATEDTLARFRIVVVELHALMLLDRARFLDGVFLPTLERLGRSFACVHAHPNNCCGSTTFGDGLVVPNVVEVTFLRRDRLHPGGDPLQLPHADDMPNVQRKPPLHLRGPLRRNADPIASDRNALEQTTAWLRTRVASPNDVLAREPARAASVAARLLDAGTLARWKPSVEDDPVGQGSWAHLDLNGAHALDAILVQRSDVGRDQHLTVSLSLDGEAWSEVHDQRRGAVAGGPTSDGVLPLLIPLDGTNARTVRLEWAPGGAVPVDWVEVYGKATVSPRVSRGDERR